MDMGRNESPMQAKLLDLADIQPPIPDNQPKNMDTQEFMDKLSIYANIVEVGINNDSW